MALSIRSSTSKRISSADMIHLPFRFRVNARSYLIAEPNARASQSPQRLSGYVSSFADDPGIDVSELPVKDTQVNALDHSHVVELHAEALLLHLFQFATA